MTSPDRTLLAGLFDDAAVFPPGDLPLVRAVPAHLKHHKGAYAGLVGPFVLAAADLGPLAAVVASLPEGSLDLAVTVPLPGIGDAVAAVGRIHQVRLAALEVVLPEGEGAREMAASLCGALGGRDLPVFVEVPRDGREGPLLAALAGTPYLAKFRTGGMRADRYPGEKELAGSVLAAVRAGVPFKATAGLHHALRNTDPRTGFEQHGFLNLLAATGAALDGAGEAELVEVLGDRDGSRMVDRVRALSPRVRGTFRSFGTCSIVEPIGELVALGLLPTEVMADLS